MILWILILDFVLHVLRGFFLNYKRLFGLHTNLPPPAKVTINSALHTVCPEHLPARETAMGGNIMLIAHTPRFIVVKNPPASKKILFPSHLNSSHIGRALQHAHSAGKLFVFLHEIPNAELASNLPATATSASRSAPGHLWEEASQGSVTRVCTATQPTTKGHFIRSNMACTWAISEDLLGVKHNALLLEFHSLLHLIYIFEVVPLKHKA